MYIHGNTCAYQTSFKKEKKGKVTHPTKAQRNKRIL